MTVWLSRRLVVAIHDEQLRRHGGAEGVRDEGFLESALVARPHNHAGYGDPDTAELGALYAVAIARNPPFVDGNKRAAFGVMAVFLTLNGIPLEANEAEAVVITLAMAAGEIPEEEFVAWVRQHAVPEG